MFYISVLIAVFGIFAAIIKKREVPESISEMIYVFHNKVFVLWVAAVSFLMTPLLIKSTGLLGGIIALSLFGIAASSAFKKELTTFHYVCGYIVALVTTIAVFVFSPWLFLIWVIYFIAMIANTPSSWLFWAEMVLYLQIILINI